MKVFLDTNILLDLLLEREGYEDSARLFELQDDGKLKLYVSFLTMVNVSYVYKKTVGQNVAIANLKYLSTLVEVLPMNGEQLQQALLMTGPDFEDILQASCAAEAHCDYLITRNQKDFKISKGLSADVSLPAVLTPKLFLETVPWGF
ncbi:MAG: PIN domain-containing protein [Bacteroidales bacterium]|nr:PIN domain-containing protein [Bacteroidales bacterium]